jgi:NADPH-dependent 2,4-dienoyl-CoA reductase/sulfur reductase-like enzyme
MTPVVWQPGAVSIEHVAVAGASLAGLRACEALRADGFAGRITLIGAEPHLPYDRPPLSKKLLAGKLEPEQIHLRKPADIDGLGLDLRLGVPATALDPDAIRVHLADGSVVDADGLVIATGAAPRRLPDQPELDGVFVLRTLDDALALRARLGAGVRIVVVGAGFIGLEVAATARQVGAEVTVLEGLAAPLVRGIGAAMGEAVARVHARHGVAIRCGVRVERLAAAAGRVVGVDVVDGDRREVVPADIVLVAIGVSPATGWLTGSGLQLDDGVVCDAALATGRPGVYAAGDVVRWPNELFGEMMRIEHWTNAAEQGAAAARSLLAWADGVPPSPYAPVPFFWSDQFEARVQFLGRAGDGDDVEVHVVHGHPDDERFVALYGRAGRLSGVLGLSSPKLVMPFRKLLAERASLGEALAFAATQPST